MVSTGATEGGNRGLVGCSSDGGVCCLGEPPALTLEVVPSECSVPTGAVVGGVEVGGARSEAHVFDEGAATFLGVSSCLVFGGILVETEMPFARGLSFFEPCPSRLDLRLLPLSFLSNILELLLLSFSMLCHKNVIISCGTT